MASGGRFFCCPMCAQSSTRAVNAEAHLFSAKHGAGRVFCCKLCARSFTQVADFNRHTHGGGRFYCCALCAQASTRPGDANRHVRTHSGGRFFCCALCARTSTEPGHASRHAATHGGGGRFFCCALCAQTSTRPGHATLHEATHGGGGRFYCCALCARASTNSTVQQYHESQGVCTRAPCTVAPVGARCAPFRPLALFGAPPGGAPASACSRHSFLLRPAAGSRWPPDIPSTAISFVAFSCRSGSPADAPMAGPPYPLLLPSAAETAAGVRFLRPPVGLLKVPRHPRHLFRGAGAAAAIEAAVAPVADPLARAFHGVAHGVALTPAELEMGFALAGTLYGGALGDGRWQDGSALAFHSADAAGMAQHDWCAGALGGSTKSDRHPGAACITVRFVGSAKRLLRGMLADLQYHDVSAAAHLPFVCPSPLTPCSHPPACRPTSSCPRSSSTP